MKFLEKARKLININVNKKAVPSFPGSVLIEPTNACNLRCRMCPAYGEEVTRRRDIGFMPRDLWMQAIDEIASWNVPVNLDLHGAGEPLLHPEFFDIVSYAKSKNNINVGFLSNATLLNTEKAKAIIELDVNWVCFSVDGAEKEIFEYYRKGAQLDVVEENIDYLLSLRKKNKPTVSLNMVRHEESDINKFIQRWTGLVDALSLSIKRPVTQNSQRMLNLLKPCQTLYQQLVVAWDGKTGLCCEDFWLDHVTGEFPKQSLYQIWHGKYLTKARKLHELGKSNKLELCKRCDSIFFHLFKEKIMEDSNKKTIVREELSSINPELAEFAKSP